MAEAAAARLAPFSELVRRSIIAERDYTLSRRRVLESLPGNPVGITYRRIGVEAVALQARHISHPGFNSVVGLRDGQEGHVASLVEWYREAGIDSRFEIVPAATRWR